MAGRASIVGAAATHVGKVREHNEDAHYFDADTGVFVVCDGMGGHAAGEVASALAIRTIRQRWTSPETQSIADRWVEKGTPEARKQLLGALRDGVLAAHEAIITEGAEDEDKSGMGTTLVGGMIVGNELVMAHAGDSRAYLVRDGIAMQLTEDHTLLSRLLAAGIDVDVSGEGSRFRSMLTNALGIGQECKVATFAVPLADGDRFLLCSDGISEYVPEAEVGKVLTTQPSPARAAQKLIELALERGGGDNATAVVVRVLEAGDSPSPADVRRQEDAVIESCPLWGDADRKLSPQQRLRALRIALSREYSKGEMVPAHTLGDRVAWILVEGVIERGDEQLAPGALVYPESLVTDAPAPDKESLAVARSDVRLLALRADDFRELCEEDAELGEALLESLMPLVSKRPGKPTLSDDDAPVRASTDSEPIDPPPPVGEPLPITIGAPVAVRSKELLGRAPTPLAVPQLKLEDVEAKPEAAAAPAPAAPPASAAPPAYVWTPRSTPIPNPRPPAPATTPPTTPAAAAPGTVTPATTTTPSPGAAAAQPPAIPTPRSTPIPTPRPPAKPAVPSAPPAATAPRATGLPPLPPLRRATGIASPPSPAAAAPAVPPQPPVPSSVPPRNAAAHAVPQFELEPDPAAPDDAALSVPVEPQPVAVAPVAAPPPKPKSRAPITPESSSTASGTIDADEPARPRRASDGWDD